MAAPKKSVNFEKTELSFQKAQDFLEHVTGFNFEDPLFQAIFIGVVIILLTSIFWILWGAKPKRKEVLILGLCEAGKTSLLTWLLYQQPVMTHTSIKGNDGVYRTSKKKLWNLFDLPGHEKLRTIEFDKHKLLARAIIFVLDSQTLSKEIKDVAEFIFNILTDSVVIKNGLPILIACNKQDLTLTKAWKVIKSQLEKEINTVRITHSAALNSTNPSSGDDVATNYLGKPGQEFHFEDLPRNKVTFIECSASKNPNVLQVDDVRTWLDSM